MENKTINNIKLGIFIISGLLILVVSLYLIGQNQNFFGSNFSLVARFRNVNGLMPGNNVRFSGIQCGTVRGIDIINDTTIEVRMSINQKTSAYIRSNAHAAIGSEGLMGNKVVNIFPGSSDAPIIKDGGILRTGAEKGLDDILGTLSATGDNALAISSSLKKASDKINGSPAFTELLADTTLALNVQRSLSNICSASEQIREASVTINRMIEGIKQGKGAAGILLNDSKTETNVAQIIAHINNASERADKLITGLDTLAQDLRADLNQGTGTAHLLLKDSFIVNQLQHSIDNIDKGTGAFNESMEALKHNFLLRGYFRKQQRKKNK